MLGVLLTNDGTILKAYSGVINGLKDPEHYFVPPIYDLANPDDFYLQEDKAISALNREIMECNDASTIGTLKQKRREMSLALQLKIFRHFNFINARGAYKNVVDIFQEAKRGLPPGGTGECAAPRLIQEAFRQSLTPTALAEFWYGQSPKSFRRVHGQFYPSCIEKCSPILSFFEGKEKGKGKSEKLNDPGCCPSIFEGKEKGKGESEKLNDPDSSPSIFEGKEKGKGESEKLNDPGCCPSIFEGKEKGKGKSEKLNDPGCCPSIFEGKEKGKGEREKLNDSDSCPEIFFEDERILVISKPSGLLSVPGKDLSQPSVESWLKERYPECKLPFMLVHRLDQATSGLLIAAKDAQTHKLLQQAFEQKTIHKRYVALLEGELPSDCGVVSLPICPNPDDRPRQTVDWQFGKPAVTRYNVLKREAGRTLIELFPLTGRTHQLRLHCASPFGLDHPIEGDELYFSHHAERLMLHAESMTLELWEGIPLKFHDPASFE